MTDRELLELAANAAGINIFDWTPGGQPTTDGAYTGIWNPLIDDGDALRLAVKLGITPHQYSTCVAAKRHRGDGIDCEESFGTDPYAATRRAIVRAAASIGKDMP